MKDGRIAAIFDVDGTLVTGRSLERTFLGFLVRHHELGLRELSSLAAGIVEGNSLRRNRSHLRGKDPETLAHLARVCVREEVVPRLLTKAIDRIRMHRTSGHEIALISGTLDILLFPLAEFLGVDIASGTALETSRGRLTGRIAGVHPFGEGKLSSLLTLQSRYDFDLPNSFAYANHHTDAHLLEAVGNPVATNPDRRLRRIAMSRGWLIEDFVSQSPGEVISHALAKQSAQSWNAY